MSLGTSLAFIAGLQTLGSNYNRGWSRRRHKKQMAGVMVHSLTFNETPAIIRSCNADHIFSAAADVSIALAGFPSVNYAGHTIVTHLWIMEQYV